MSITIDGKTAFVTGASRGMGRAIAEALAHAGCKVAMVARSAEQLEEAAQALRVEGFAALGLPADVSSEKEVTAAVQRCIKHFGTLDILICNAGIDGTGTVETLDLSEWNKVMTTNLTGPFLCCQNALRYLGSESDIIIIASGAAYSPMAGRSAYCASKAGLKIFAECLALEVRDKGIRVSSIYPGSTATSFADRSESDEGWKLLPENVADAVLAILQTPRRAWISDVTVRPQKTRPK